MFEYTNYNIWGISDPLSEKGQRLSVNKGILQSTLYNESGYHIFSIFMYKISQNANQNKYSIQYYIYFE